MKPTLLILAAGVGSRYGGLKQLDKFGPGGETIIDYSVFDAIRAGFGKLVFIIRKDIEAPFREHIGSKYSSKIQVEYCFQELDCLPEGFSVPEGRKKPWGTGHAILVGAPAIQEPFGVINGDDYYGAQSFQILADALRKAQDGSRADYSMVGFTLRNTLSDFGSVSRGVCSLDEEGNLAKVVEHTQIEREGRGAKYTSEDNFVKQMTGDEIVSMNMWGFTPSIFKHLESQFIDFLKAHGQEMKSEYFIPSVVSHLIETHRADVKVNKTPDSWFGVTYPEDKEMVVNSIRRLINTGIYPEKLWER